METNYLIIKTLRKKNLRRKIIESIILIIKCYQKSSKNRIVEFIRLSSIRLTNIICPFLSSSSKDPLGLGSSSSLRIFEDIIRVNRPNLKPSPLCLISPGISFSQEKSFQTKIGFFDERNLFICLRVSLPSNNNSAVTTDKKYFK